MLSRNDSSVLSGHARTASPAGDGGQEAYSPVSLSKTHHTTPLSSPTSSSSPSHSTAPSAAPTPAKLAPNEGTFTGGGGGSSGLQSPMQEIERLQESGHIVETSAKQNRSPLRTPPTGRRGEYRAAMAEASYLKRVASPRSGKKSDGGNPLLHPPLPNLRVNATNGTIVSSGVCMTCGVDPKGTPDGVPAIPSVLATELVRLERENRTLRVSPSFPPFCFFPPNLSPNLFERGSHHNRPYIFARVRSTIHADWQGGVYD